MSIAWATIALLLFLLPGFFFLAGLFVPEQFTRETASQSTLGQLASIIFISLLVHTVGFALVADSCEGTMPCPSVLHVLAFFQMEGSDAIPLAELAQNVEQNFVAISSYLTATTFTGFGAGWLTGFLIVSDFWFFGRFAKHRWLLRTLGTDRLQKVGAHVLTRVSESSNFLMYAGSLEALGLRADG